MLAGASARVMVIGRSGAICLSHMLIYYAERMLVDVASSARLSVLMQLSNLAASALNHHIDIGP